MKNNFWVNPLSLAVKKIMKICVQGDRNSGKTYYIRKNFPYNVSGLITKRIKTGVSIGYMENHKIKQWKKCAKIINGKVTIIKDTFEKFGVEILENLYNIDDAKTIVIDEVGFLELSAPLYCNMLKKLFNKKKNIIVALRNESNIIIDYLKNHKSAEIIKINKFNPGLIGESIFYRIKSKTQFTIK